MILAKQAFHTDHPRTASHHARHSHTQGHWQQQEHEEQEQLQEQELAGAATAAAAMARSSGGLEQLQASRGVA